MKTIDSKDVEVYLEEHYKSEVTRNHSSPETYWQNWLRWFLHGERHPSTMSYPKGTP